MSRRLPVLPLLLLLIGIAAGGGCGSNDTKLKVTGIEPEKGDVEGGTYVRIKGNRFIADGARNAKVYFGSRQGTVARFASDSELIVEAPVATPNAHLTILIIFYPAAPLQP